MNEIDWNTLVPVFVAATTGIASPLLLAWQLNRSKRAERQEDYDRQDAVAAKAAEAAQLLLAANERVAIATGVTNEKLEVIHTLVNSSMTEALQQELNATQRELAMMLEVIELRKHAGQEPSIQTLATVRSTEDRIAELNATLSTRKQQTTRADALASGS